MNKIKEFLTTDTKWKLISLILAFCLWFMVINIENPTETKNFSVNLTVSNQQYAQQSGRVIMNIEELESKRVSVRITAKRMDLEKISAADVSAYIDIASINLEAVGDIISLPVKPKLNNTVSGDAIAEIVSDSNMLVEIEKLISAEFPVEVWFGGDKDSDINVISQRVDPSSVTVTGAESVVNNVASVRAIVSLDNTYDGQAVSVPLSAYDAEGNVIDNVELSANNAETVIRLETSRNIPVRAGTVGEVADGCSLLDVKVEPEYITVHGNPDILKNVIYIDIPDMDVEGASEDIEKSFVVSVFLPDGLRTANGNNDIVKVTAEITGEKETKVSFDSDNIEIRGELAEGLEAFVEKDSYNFEILGNTFNKNYMKVYVDVTGLEVGEHRLELNFELNGDGKFAGNEPYATVVIKEKEVIEEVPEGETTEE